LNDLLEEKREAKKIAETSNDRLKLETKSAAELLKNQMERQLARDKGEEITDLREKQRIITELNEEMLKKLAEEKAKFDQLK